MIGQVTRPLIIAGLFLVSACGGTSWDWDHPITPVFNKIHGIKLPEGMSASANAGWDDGCKTGYNAYGDNMYKAIYGFHRDANKVGDADYERNWYDGYNYCRQSINTYINQGWFTP